MPILRKAWEKAFATDKHAPFGGIIVCNRAMDRIVGPRYQRNLFRSDNRAGIRSQGSGHPAKEEKSSAHSPHEARVRDPRSEIRSVARRACSFRIRTPPNRRDDRRSSRNGSRRRQEIAAMLFGWRVVKHVKSNAIVYAARIARLGLEPDRCRASTPHGSRFGKQQEAGLSLKAARSRATPFFRFPTA